MVGYVHTPGQWGGVHDFFSEAPGLWLTYSARLERAARYDEGMLTLFAGSGS